MRSLIAAALRNRISAIGVALTTASGCVFLVLVILQFTGIIRSPYAGIVVFVMLPLLFLIGLLFIPFGLWRGGTRLGAPAAGGTLVFVAAATAVNLGLLSFASYGAVHYSESQQFCGQACHPVMEPQFVAHRSGAHGRVPCVSCHIEPGAQGFIKAKMNGTHQLALVLMGDYPKPIPSPPQTGLPNVHTSCEQCHWPDRFIGDVIKVVYEHADDEKNTETKTTLRLHVGGPISGTTNGTGIHWHMNRGNRVEYLASDSSLEKIPYVRISTPDGKVREYFTKEVPGGSVQGRTLRPMVCIDCHNRPAHRFASTVERSVDAAIGAGQISARIPFVRREAVRALKAEYATKDAAIEAIATSMRSSLKSGSAGESEIAQAIAVTQELYRTNVFPAMKIGWGTYKNQVGHVTSDGCFRCHDDEHKTREGAALGQDCESCHSIE